MTQQASSRRTMIAVALVFVLPVVLAYLALQDNWFNKGVTNKGRLLDPVLSLQSITEDDNIADSGKWQVIAVLPDACQQSCEQAVYAIQQVHTALGREQDRAELLVLAEGQHNALQDLDVVTLASTRHITEQLKIAAEQAFTLVADPHGNIMLQYGDFGSPEATVLTSKAMLADVKKLLKLSKIG